jgi:hypothetical protein
LCKLLDEQTTPLTALSDIVGRRYFNLVENGVKWVHARTREEP